MIYIRFYVHTNSILIYLHINNFKDFTYCATLIFLEYLDYNGRSGNRRGSFPELYLRTRICKHVECENLNIILWLSKQKP